MKKPRMYTTLALLIAVILAVLLVPLPHKVSCVVEIRPRGAKQIYADPGGRLARIHSTPGEKVEAGSPIVDLENLNKDLQVEDLLGQREGLRETLRMLMRMPAENDGARNQIPEIKEQLETVHLQLAKLQEEQSRLKLTAPIAGTVLPPPGRPERPQTEGMLPIWSGSPLENKNLGATLTPQDHICQIGDPKSWEAVLIIDQGDIEFVRNGFEVAIRLNELPRTTLMTWIEKRSTEAMEFVPPGLSTQYGGQIPTEADPSGMQRPQSVQYQASTLELDRDQAAMMRVGLQGTGKIRAGWRTLGQRGWRFIRQTFSFTLN